MLVESTPRANRRTQPRLLGKPAHLISLLCAAGVAVEAVVVLGVLHMGAHTILGGDGVGYERYAINLVNHLVYSTSVHPPLLPSVFRTPGYPLFLALFAWLAPGSLLIVEIAQFVLLALTALLLYRVTLRVASSGAAIFSAVACASFLPFIWLATYHLTESLASFLAVAVVLLVYRARVATTISRLGLLGVAIGVLTLVRPEDALLAVVIPVGLFLEASGPKRRHGLQQALVVVVGFVLVMAPWTIRNTAVTGRFLPLGANSGQTLYTSQLQYAGRISYEGTTSDYNIVSRSVATVTDQRPVFVARNVAVPATSTAPIVGASAEIKYNDELVSAARRGFAKLSISEVVRSLPGRIEHLWGTGDFPPAGHLKTAAHGLAVVQWSALIVLALVGVIRLAVEHRIRLLWPVFIFPIYTTFVHLVFSAEARYSIPDRPFVFVFAGIGVAWLAGRLWQRDAGGRAAPGPVSANPAR